MKGDREKCLAGGTHGYLTKPIRPQELDEILQETRNSAALALDGSRQLQRNSSVAIFSVDKGAASARPRFRSAFVFLTGMNDET
jgi:hypothetical protein